MKMDMARKIRMTLDSYDHIQYTRTLMGMPNLEDRNKWSDLLTLVERLEAGCF